MGKPVLSDILSQVKGVGVDLDVVAHSDKTKKWGVRKPHESEYFDLVDHLAHQDLELFLAVGDLEDGESELSHYLEENELELEHAHLAHHGVKGMKWGVRRDRKGSSGSGGSGESSKKASSGSGGSGGSGGGVGGGSSKKSKAPKPPEGTERSGGKYTTKPRAKTDGEREKEILSKDPSQRSNAELKFLKERQEAARVVKELPKPSMADAERMSKLRGKSLKEMSNDDIDFVMRRMELEKKLSSARGLDGKKPTLTDRINKVNDFSASGVKLANTIGQAYDFYKSPAGQAAKSFLKTKKG